ncbi:MAG: protein-disulfide reductase DsbD domain-containing protein [Gammaproteobacteria bacterium]|uniref:Thiol:disulfide interchange protein n=1 Tax=SAR86 cluster bacterium TaxID=2030880 RepID=A0A838YN08_9GAMM|nr:thiol:disulfide interchange protein [SAR86 cluster bacterium]
MYKLLKLSILLLVTSICLNAQNLFDEKNDILKPSDAFATSGYIDNDLLYINWRINNGYYLYKNSVKIMNGDNELEYIIIESNESTYEDEFFGKTQILRGELFIRTSKVENLNNLLIYFQGCSDSGFCYPLQSQEISQIIF